MPSRQPSSQPTTKPSGLPQCPAGMMYVFQGDGVFTCDPCPGGQISGENSNHCTACPAGQQPLNGVECTLCPVGTYANKASTAVCTVCGANQVTPIGATSVNQCVNPLTNFIFGFFCLFFCGIAFSHYIGGGRLQRIAFIRKEMLIKQGQIMFHVLCDKIDYIGSACNDQNRQKYLDVLRVSFSVPEYCLYVFYPFMFVVQNIANIRINLTYVNVSCPGAQAPIKLLLDCVVTGIVVIIIESDMEIFWQTQLKQALTKFRGLLFNRMLTLSAVRIVMPLNDNRESLAEGSERAGEVTPTAAAHNNAVSPFRKKETVKKRHYLTSLLKLFALFSSFDWFYMKIMFRFAESLYTRLTNFHLPNTSKKHYTAHNQEAAKSSKILPAVPWFVALHVIFADGEEADEWRDLKHRWHERSNEIPSYYRMVKTVYEDVINFNRQVIHLDLRTLESIDATNTTNPVAANRGGRLSIAVPEAVETAPQKVGCCTYIGRSIAWILSWTIFAQLYSKRGRNIWLRVVRNYSVLAFATVGFWSDSSVHSFGLMRKMDEFDEIQELAERRIVDSGTGTGGVQSPGGSTKNTLNINLGSISNDALSPRTNMSTKNDAKARHEGAFLTGESIKSQKLNTFAALISARVVLIQLVPYLTAVSTLAVDISSSPVLIFSHTLSEKLPGLVILDAWSDAKKRLQVESKEENPPKWQIFCLSMYIFLYDSRLIQCFLNVCMNVFAFVIIFFGENNADMVFGLYSFIVLFAVVGVVMALYAVLLLHKLMFPVSHDENEEDDLEHSSVHSSGLDDSTSGRSVDSHTDMNTSSSPLPRSNFKKATRRSITASENSTASTAGTESEKRVARGDEKEEGEDENL
eukprot:gene23585-29814_t